MGRHITLTPEVSPYTDESQSTVRLRITATSGFGMPNEVFAYLERPLIAGAQATEGVFSHVCSPVDLEDFPINAPAANALPPWYRADRVDLLFRSRSQAEAAREAIFAGVENLILALDKLDTLQATPPTVLGTP